MKKLSILFSIIFSQAAMAADIKVENAWMRATAPGQEVAGAFMDITSTDNAKLVGATSTAAGKLELHSMSMDNGVMEMRQMKSIDLPKGKTIQLSPGGLHVMLFDLKQPMKQGETIPMTLDVLTADKHHESIKIDVSVRDLGGK
ncbi:copper chaperone PCu(A)C [Sulfuriferula nivalis]|uniref:Copper chaperone PCu(A)C n=1 Tax=Sulfuriferula nivalis TaxID=2675298 RepID=A0A809RN73_9PROT|nr:copper chaperone PCu(A)C [Sulfuriferula nivalis]BBP02224.1 hypothetical protein SFSGTM_29320 [Sulfuriferula nivalis]